MIVRIINTDEDYDKFFDCKSSTIILEKRETGKPKGFLLIVEFRKGQGDATMELRRGDRIFYMNDSGKTIATDYRMLK